MFIFKELATVEVVLKAASVKDLSKGTFILSWTSSSLKLKK